ncbi:MAG: S41 family peptidase [Planctomycetes bacterium]|nr:S41 family peptidase [Planctomycetota bacterium]
MLRVSKHLLLILSLAIILTHGRLLPAEEQAKEQDDYYKNYEELVKVVRLIKDKYVDDVEFARLLTGAYRGMLQELDPYSQYIGPGEIEDLRIETEGEFGGLGIEVIVQDGILTVITPILDSPAFKAGVMAGDKIIRIEDESAERITLREAIKKLRGEPGTEVTITVLHPGEVEPADVTIERDIVQLISVRGIKILDDERKIGYVSLTSFQEDTAEELDTAIENLLQDGMTALILDLRFNPGGLLDSAVDVSDKFLGKEVIVTTKGKDISQNHVYHAKKPGTFPDFPLVVLINKGSASAAEIVAGAIRDNKRGILVGTKTFGKGSVQSLVPVEEGLSAIKLTTAKYYTPSGKLIHEIGIEPDVVVELDSEETRGLHQYLSKLHNESGAPASGDDETSLEEEGFTDMQLQQALDILRDDKQLFTKLLDNPPTL